MTIRYCGQPLKSSRIVPGKCLNCGGAIIYERDTGGDDTRCIICGRPFGEMSESVKEAVRQQAAHAQTSADNYDPAKRRERWLREGR